jgi:hypothetical protein
MCETRMFEVTWQVLVLCLAVCVALKHFHELKRPPTDWITGDRFAVLLKMYVHYFAVRARNYISPLTFCTY